MGNWKLARWQEPQTLTRDVLREMRRGRPACRAGRSSAARSAPAWAQAVLCTLYTLVVAGAAWALAWPASQ